MRGNKHFARKCAQPVLKQLAEKKIEPEDMQYFSVT